MKLFVVIGGWYEGYDEPYGIYSTKEQAETAMEKAKSRYDIHEIMEYELDAAGRITQ